ncbi:hypothetical protein [Mycobacteroides abscessus]|uniref:hypothetical protein n=1 Tax=Mycobacteroides abscessus TaxID=36809 RepID=UPI0011B27A99|nr:hypothetical protein [Mycobacteroides abscessus]MDQ8119617.1 hypothetical protein [Mycobacteroides abscessus subsp. massiliense]
MSGRIASLVAGGMGLAIAVAGFQAWVKWAGESGVVVKLLGTGEFSSPYLVAAQEVASWHGFPIGWVTAVLGVVIVGSAVLHYIEMFEADSAVKTVVLPGFLASVAAGVVLVDKSVLLTGVPEGGLDGATPSAGVGAIVVLLGSIAAVVSGFALSVLDEPRYVSRRPSVRSRSTTAARNTNTARPTKNNAKAKSKNKSKNSAKSKNKGKSQKAGRSAPTGGESAVQVASSVTKQDSAREVEERLLTQPRVMHTGGSAGQPPIWLTHWCAQLPASLRSVLAVPGVPDGGPVLLLHPGGGVGSDDLIPAIVRDEKPWLLDDLVYASWQAGLSPILGELGRRYAVVELVRDDEWLTPLMHAAGLVTISTRLEAVPGEHGVYEREVTVIDIPVLIGAAVEQSGMVLRFASRAVDSADKWSQGLSALREGFAAEGMNTAHLHVVDGPEGGIELRFRDAEELVRGIKE